MEVIHMTTRFGDLYGIDDEPGRYDIMACNCGTHPSSYTKLDFGWLDSSNTLEIPLGARRTNVMVEAISNPMTFRPGPRPASLMTIVRSVKIPIPNSMNYYLVETRLKRDKYESNTPFVSSGIPREGVVIYLIDKSEWPYVHLKSYGLYNPGDNYGDSYGIKIKVMARHQSSFTVQMERQTVFPRSVNIFKAIKDHTLEISRLETELLKEKDSTNQSLIQQETRRHQTLMYRLRHKTKELGLTIPDTEAKMERKKRH